MIFYEEIATTFAFLLVAYWEISTLCDLTSFFSSDFAKTTFGAKFDDQKLLVK